MKAKVDAIFDLREAAEEHGRLEVAFARHPSAPRALDDLFESREKLEAATVEAMEACHECGESHETGTHA